MIVYKFFINGKKERVNNLKSKRFKKNKYYKSIFFLKVIIELYINVIFI